jgi:hypothetical protein
LYTDAWSAPESHALWLVRQCILPTSQKTYKTGWRRWIRFAEQLNFSEWLDKPPNNWNSACHAFDFQTVAIIYFMFCLFINDGLAAATVSNYVAAVAYHLQCCNINCDFLSSVAVLKARSSLAILCRQRKAEREVGSLPATLDLIERFKAARSVSNFRNKGVYTAMRLAHLLLLRVSEYTVTPADHFLRAQDVTFVFAGRRRPSHALDPSDRIEEVIGVLIDVRSAKNDKSGQGHRFYFRRDALPTSAGTCIASLLFEWASLSDLRNNQSFFTYRSIWRLRSEDISSALKSVAATVGLDPDRFHPHSLRYGGASTLAAANVPTYMIQKLGRWKSLAFLQYIQFSESLLNSAQKALSDTTTFTVADIFHLHPGALITPAS